MILGRVSNYQVNKCELIIINTHDIDIVCGNAGVKHLVLIKKSFLLFPKSEK